LRYRTGDITSLDYETCACGRTAVRMDNVTGRTDDLLIVRGINVYPSQIEAVLVDFESVAPHYRIDLRREGQLDTMEITVEHHGYFDGSRERLERQLRDALKKTLDIRPNELRVVGPGVIDRSEVGKVQRVFDHR
jgi:phenylacetate-CoA ligase